MDSNIIIFSALRVEYQEVKDHLTDIQEIMNPWGKVYEEGIFSYGNQSRKVTIVEVGRGNVSAAVETGMAIGYINPKIVLFVGVAGGIKDVNIGDVVVATKVYGYESGKAGETFTSSPEVYPSSPRLIARAKAEAKKADWLTQLKPKASEKGLKVLVEPIAAGDKLITSYNSLYEFIQNNFRDAVAVDMEGYGFLYAAYAYQVPALIIRGISDLIKDKKGDKNQEMASQHASAFAFQILAKLCPELKVSLTIS